MKQPSLASIKLKHYLPERWTIVLLLVSLFSAIAFILKTRAESIISSLDWSYVYAYNSASHLGMAWGKDFVSTYGPLGFLVHYVDVSHNFWWSQLFSLMLVLVSVAIITTFTLRLGPKSRVGQLIVVVALTYAVGIQVDEWAVMLLLVLGLITLRSFEWSHRRYGYIVLGIIAWLMMLIKFSLGFGALALVGVSCIFEYDWQARAVSSGFAGAGFIIGAISTVSLLPIVSIPAYLRGGIEMTNGYSAAMSFAAAHSLRSAAILLIFIALFLALLLWARKKLSYFAVIIMILALATAWKYGLVRQDDHLIAFVCFAVGLIILVVSRVFKRKSAPYILVASTLMVGMLITAAIINPVDKTVLAGQFLPYRGITHTISSYTHPTRFRLALSQDANTMFAAYKLTEEQRNLVGASSVDVYPWSSVIVPANDLNWVSRPQSGSFAAYTPYIDNKDATFFNSHQAPKFIIWKYDLGVGSIDGRHIYFDEPATLAALMSWYKPVSTQGDVTVLERQTSPTSSPTTTTKTITAAWGSWVKLPPAKGSVRANIGFHPNALVKLVRSAYRLDPILLTAHQIDGKEVSWRVVPDNLMQGLLIGALPSTSNELTAALSEQLPGNIDKIKITSNQFISHNSAPLTYQFELTHQ